MNTMNKTKDTITMQASRLTQACRRLLATVTGFTVLIERRLCPLPVR
jgi:hypothetical protein